MRKTMQFLIDNICADFTVDSLLDLVRACLTSGRPAIADITSAIMQKDSSLDVSCAEGLARGALMALADSGEVEVSAVEGVAILRTVPPLTGRRR